MWRYLIRPLLFQLDAEWVHYFAMNSFTLGMSLPWGKSLLSSMTHVRDSSLKAEFLGLEFDSPVGLAAGFDKDARWFDQLSALGFSHIEVGTLTGQPQAGNPKKRLFRFSADQALLNCMGFNNRGSEAARQSMESSAKKGGGSSKVLGINIGLSKSVAVAISNDEDSPGKKASDEQRMQMAIDDYLLSFRRMFPFADYFAINVSSPNTRGLRDLQAPEKIGQLIHAIRKENQELAGASGSTKPILVKLAPDLSEREMDETLEALVGEKVDGLIATNTTISAADLKTSPARIAGKRCQCPQPGGGFSGRPLTIKSREFVARVYRRTKGKLPIIGVGGILSGEDAWEMIGAGASMVQVYTGFIYGGPFFVRQVNRYLADRLEKEGLSTIGDLVGRHNG